MPPKLPKKLPLRQEVNHRSKLEQSVKQPTLTPYCIALPELKELWKQIKNIFTRLRLYSVHWSSSKRRKIAFLQMCINYRALNKITIKNNDSIPLIVDIFNQLGKAWYFTKLNLGSGYYQVQITKGNKLKSNASRGTDLSNFFLCCLPYFAPATFRTLMSKVLWLFFHCFIVVYLDDIMVYITTLE